MRLRLPQRDEIPGLAGSTAIAVDLGFAEKSRSCGLAWRTSGNEPQAKHLDFGQCVKETAGFLSSNADSVLIVEAPLSGLLNPNGNPRGRGPFEKAIVGTEYVPRYWYVGAGAAVGLGGVFLFSRLASLLDSGFNVVNVIEGFVSFKTSSSEHKEDALALLDGLRYPDSAKLYNVEAGEGEQRINMLCFAGLVSESDPCPAVMVMSVR